MDKYLYINNENIRMYNPETFWKRTKPCWVTVNAGDNTLMSWDGEFLTKDVIDRKCACEKMNTCKALVDLLKNGKVEVAKKMINN